MKKIALTLAATSITLVSYSAFSAQEGEHILWRQQQVLTTQAYWTTYFLNLKKTLATKWISSLLVQVKR